jgi:hypothetical protein
MAVRPVASRRGSRPDKRRNVYQTHFNICGATLQALPYVVDPSGRVARHLLSLDHGLTFSGFTGSKTAAKLCGFRITLWPWNRRSSAQPPSRTNHRVPATTGRPSWRPADRTLCADAGDADELNRDAARSLSRASSAARNALALTYWHSATVEYLLQNSVDPRRARVNPRRRIQSRTGGRAGPQWTTPRDAHEPEQAAAQKHE